MDRQAKQSENDWTTLSAWLPDEWRGCSRRRRSATAASFAAMLELARRGALEIRQEGTFQPLYLRRREEQPE